MKQTAVEWLIDQIINNNGVNQKTFEQAKQMEKEQIIDAAERWKGTDFAERYYNETYGSDDKKINLVEIPQEQLEKERNPNYKYFDIDESTSSPTEISDEEIEKASIGNATFAPSFINGAKWYREQLKQTL